MKPFLLIPVLVLCAMLAKANPLPPPPPICELILNQNGFVLELDLSIWGISNLDNLRLTTSSHQANFNPDIPVIYGSLVIVTEEDLQSPLYIDPVGDELILEEYLDTEWWEIDRICFGNHPDSRVSAPSEEESIVRQEFGSAFNHFHWIVKNKPPSPDSLPYWTNSRGTFSGYVLDKNSTGVPYAWIKYCDEELNGIYPALVEIYADSSGYFYCDNMFSRKYDIQIIMFDEIYWTDQIVVELDSNNYYEFIIDSLAVGISEATPELIMDIWNYPNPFKYHTTFDITMPESYDWNEARITIRDMNGRVMDRIDRVNKHQQGSLKIIWSAPDHLDAGIYIYTLKVDDKRIASNKMILSR